MGKKNYFFRNYNYQQTIEYYQEQGTSTNSWITKIFIFLITSIVCTLFFTMHFNLDTDSSLELRTVPGYQWTNKKVIAEYTFPIYKSQYDYSSEISKARANALHVFERIPNAEKTAKNALKSFRLLLVDFCRDSVDRDVLKINETIEEQLVLMPKKSCVTLVNSLMNKINNYIGKCYKSGFTDESVSSILQNEITVISQPNSEIYLSKSDLVDISTIADKFKNQYEDDLSEEQIIIAIEILSSINYPNLKYSDDLTQKNRRIAEQSVARYEGLVRKGETIISKGEIVTESTIKKLLSYTKTQKLKSEFNYTLWSLLGSFGHSIIIYSILILYLFFIRKRIFSDNFQVGTLSVLLILSALFAWLSITIPTKIPIEFLIAIPSLSMLAAIVFDSRTAFYTTIAMGLMVSGIRGNDYLTGLIMMFTGIIAAYTVRDIQNRTQMFQSILFILLAFVFSIGAISLERSSDFDQTLNQLFMAAINSLIAPMITFGFLLLLERYTNITTDLKLQEYDRQNHPLLSKLSEIAPGTYQHTLTMASLAERCAGAIGANPLLSKVGALYHDIGKLAKPDYFVENQLDSENKHDEMTPQKSAESIRHHVLEGIKMAHEYKLPQRIIDFIPTHHGTTLIKHFYALALENADNKEDVNENDFRYPGPKPYSKETAIVMICDFSEAISRLVGKENDELDKALQSNIRERLLDGQFDECNLTLKELELIKNTCVKSLLGTTHHRVQYKEIPKESEENEEK